ncbi:NAC domain-containing protein 2-like [Rutidosis leptorrhynchoides]|uniref:NAC domain-containing protein 2-like n=1 Tax=Rutidosis leptorrhynchoides TaxID=125765 RepID=UPI003A9A4486
MEKEEFEHLPPGFRFHPSDEELIIHYLLNKVKLRPIPAAVIGEIELYHFDPWDLPLKALFGKDEWYFFTLRDKKYPNGSRPKRSAGSGFWKATGKDKPIFASSGSRKIGVKKALSFFKGNSTNSVKTDWTMSEYRLPESSSRSTRLNGSMRLDDWVLCRIRQKGNNSNKKQGVEENKKHKFMDVQLPLIEQELPSSYMITKAKLDIISDHRVKEFQLMASILAGHDLPPMNETCSPKLFQEDTNNENEGLYKERGQFMLGDDALKQKHLFSGDMLVYNDPYTLLNGHDLDVVMTLIKEV